MGRTRKTGEERQVDHQGATHLRIPAAINARLDLLRAKYPSLETRTALILFAVDVGLSRILDDPEWRP